jgi:hypothetical protein
MLGSVWVKERVRPLVYSTQWGRRMENRTEDYSSRSGLSMRLRLQRPPAAMVPLGVDPLQGRRVVAPKPY